MIRCDPEYICSIVSAGISTALPLSIDEYFFHLAPVPSLFKILPHNIDGFLFNFNNFLLRRPEGYEEDIITAAAVSLFF